MNSRLLQAPARFIRTTAFILLAAASLRLSACTSVPTPPPESAAPAMQRPTPSSTLMTNPWRTEIIEGTMTHTAAPNGEWRSFFNASDAPVVAANADAIWFSRNGRTWRYNVKQKRIDANRSISVNPGNAALADDGRLASGSLLWTPGKGWARLPMAGGGRGMHYPTFDADDSLFASNFRGTYRWSDGAWSDVSDLRIESTSLRPVPGGWVHMHYFTFVPPTLKHLKDANQFPAERKEYDQLALFFRLRGQSLAMFLCRPGKDGWDSVPYALCRLTAERFEESGRALHIGLDLKTGEGFRCVPDPDAKNAAIESFAGGPSARISLPPDFHRTRTMMLRDANGDYWLGPRMYDGRSWTTVLPEGAFEYRGNVRDAIVTGRLLFDDARRTWIDSHPELPSDVQAYDAQTRIGWLKRNAQGGYEEDAIFDCIEFAADGSRKLLASVALNSQHYPLALLRLADNAGNWWFRGRWRWDGKTTHYYEDGYRNISGPEDQAPDFAIGRSGAVWRYRVNRTCDRYDALADRFTPGNPYDDFAFDFCGRKLSIAGRLCDRQGDSILHALYEKRGEEWRPFQWPMGTREGGNAKSHVWGCRDRMMHGNRMLLNTSGGIFKWDAETDRWAFLLPGTQQWALFDDRGRRIIVSDFSGSILMYEGEPMNLGNAPLGTSLAPQVEQFLQQMDDESWRRRDDPTRAMINLMRTHPREVGDALQERLRGPVSPELKARIPAVLAEKPQQNTKSYEENIVAFKRRIGNSLYERMSEPLVTEFRGGYTIRVGMRFDLAEAIFQSAGAERTFGNNQGPLRRGFLLPDNTMVYLQLSTMTPTTIEHIGMGTFAAGWDRSWNWEDPGKNALETLDLKPAGVVRNQ